MPINSKVTIWNILAFKPFVFLRIYLPTCLGIKAKIKLRRWKEYSVVLSFHGCHLYKYIF